MEAISETEHSTWIKITDDMIKNVGYKTKGRKGHDRDNMFRYVKRTYNKDTQYKLTKSDSGDHESCGRRKLILEMTRAAYDDLLIQTHNLRTKKIKTKKHYIYVMHNPMFLQYGPNVYKIGYSKNVERRMRDYFTSYIDEPEIVYRREVTSQDSETQLHRLIRIKKTREFFDCPLQKIIEFIEML